MKVKGIYDAALRILGEPGDSGTDSDYADRAPYIAAAFCASAASADRDFRETHKLGEQGKFGEVYVSLEDDFPFCERFVSAGVYYMAAMLVLDSDEDLSDSLFAKYADALSAAISEIPATSKRIKDVYRY